jgi:S-adenosylmethionine:tRNA-ribosyltransferase-isomerase (queuine synthetase)
MVEKAILESKEYPTRTELWNNLPTKIQYQTFKHILDYLEASGRIVFNDKKILYTGVNNSKLRAIIKSSVRVR